MFRVDDQSEEDKIATLKIETLKEEITDELTQMDDVLNQSTCASNSWAVCLRALSSAYIGQAASLSSYLTVHRLLLHHLSPESETLILISSLVPGLLSAYAIWWGTGQMQNYFSTRSNQQILDKLIEQIDELKDSVLVGHPVDVKQSKCWAGFLSTSRYEEYQLLRTDDLESGVHNKPSY